MIAAIDDLFILRLSDAGTVFPASFLLTTVSMYQYNASNFDNLTASQLTNPAAGIVDGGW
jgi:hypothetical protein